ncbi:hypothetical protein T484DRAFT_1824883, partial [Baffinella frigidus]
LGLDALGVIRNKDGSIPVDKWLETSIEGIYAAGDVLGAPALASTGIEQGARPRQHGHRAGTTP